MYKGAMWFLFQVTNEKSLRKNTAVERSNKIRNKG